MSLNHVILGLLNSEPLSGYEIKKIIEKSPYMHWSGNNNQIYKSFAQLLDEGFVTKEVHHQNGAPSKNIYSITEDGLTEFRKWMLTISEEPSFKKEFLIKLSLAGAMKNHELESMLGEYENVVRMHLILADKERSKDKTDTKIPEGKRVHLDFIHENICSFYETELSWISKVKSYLNTLPQDERQMETEDDLRIEKEIRTMDTRIIETKNHKRVLHIRDMGTLLTTEQECLDIISLCAEHDVSIVLLEGSELSDSFTQLRTGVAGGVLQKFTNYHIKAAAVVEGNREYPLRFREMSKELERGSTFRIFNSLEDAKNWL